MFTTAIFIVSLTLMVLLFFLKAREISTGRKFFLENLFLKCDDHIFKIILKTKHWWGHINFKNTKLIFFWVIASIKRLIIIIKRFFDHKQSHFFTKREHPTSKSKGSVSFFLKDVSDYKRNLREGNRDIN